MTENTFKYEREVTLNEPGKCGGCFFLIESESSHTLFCAVSPDDNCSLADDEGNFMNSRPEWCPLKEKQISPEELEKLRSLVKTELLEW